jgi:putative drug exporter of the RND superfamily
MTESLARWCSRHPGRVVAIWLVALLACLPAIAVFLGDVLTADVRVTAETESSRADELLDRAFPQSRAEREREPTEAVVARATSGSIDSPAARERVAELADGLRAAGASDVVTAPASEDRDARVLLVALGSDGDDDVESVYDVVERFDADPAYEVAITGELTSEADQDELSGEDLRTGELFFGLPAACVILLLVFGAVVAGLVPLLLAVLSIFVALGLAALVGQVWDLSIFTVNMLSGMGLALGVDYALFILSRYREERARGRERLEAIDVTGATASRAILFSGLTFVLAMVGLLLVPSTIFRSLAAGAILVGIVSVLAALTLMPAVLGRLGDRIDAGRIPFFGRPGGGERFWRRIVRGVMRRPLLSLVLGAGFLLALALPTLSLDTGSQGASALPDRFESKRGYVLLNEEFPGRTTDPVEIAVRPEDVVRVEAAIERHQLLGTPAVETGEAGDVARVTVPIGGDPVGDRAIDTARDLRADLAATGALVTGDTAEELDYHDTVDAWLPRVFALVLGLSFVLLTIAFRSIVVPLKAIALNLLSVGAAYGLLVLVFQEGIGAELLGLTESENVAAWVPLFLFSVLFGLSMDYQVFLLSRIRERYELTGDSDEAVEWGVASTARLITGAALIIIAVFWGFAMGDLIMFQQMGFGVAVALLLDATIVRAVLVPAAMKLLGSHNWYLPGWLSWLPDAHVEGSAARP